MYHGKTPLVLYMRRLALCHLVLTNRYFNIDINLMIQQQLLNVLAQDPGTRKAVALVRYVDLHNDYVLEEGKHPVKYVELFQMFK